MGEKNVPSHERSCFLLSHNRLSRHKQVAKDPPQLIRRHWHSWKSQNFETLFRSCQKRSKFHSFLHFSNLRYGYGVVEKFIVHLSSPNSACGDRPARMRSDRGAFLLKLICIRLSVCTAAITTGRLQRRAGGQVTAQDRYTTEPQPELRRNEPTADIQPGRPPASVSQWPAPLHRCAPHCWVQ